jgi:hypothetical protein
MTDGMKSGAGSDPFADDTSDDEASEGAETTAEATDPVPTTGAPDGEETASQPSSNSSDSSAAPSGDGLPYIFERNGVKDNRKMVQYFLQADTEDIEDEVKHAVEQEFGTDVYLTDIREALVRVGANHIEEVADELRGWGYRYEE